MKFCTILCFLFLGFSACNETPGDTRHQANLVGDWRGIKWEIAGKPSSKTARSLILRFSGDGQYVGDLGASPERGSYQLNGEKLYLTHTDKTEVTGVIQYLNTDTLVLGFIHRGNPEQMTLIRRY